MNRLINVAMKEPKVAVRMGAVALLTSLRTSTKTAKKIAPVRTSKSGRGRRVDGKRIFYVERYDRDGKLYRRTIFANSLAEAKQDRSAQIFYHGLAKASWGWTMHRLFPNKAARKQDSASRKTYQATQTGDAATTPSRSPTIRLHHEGVPHKREDLRGNRHASHPAP